VKTKRVLIVEDDPSVAFLLREGLSDLGDEFQVSSVRSGEDALRQMETDRWDLVVTDNRMPGITGLELVETLKTKAPSTLTILITAYGSDDVQQAAQRLNVHHYLTKPFPLADLRRVIQEAFALSRNAEPTTEPAELPPPLKIALSGDGGVGKTTLIRRLCTGKFNGERRMTIGVDFHLYDLDVRNTTARLIVWDVSGQDHFAFTRRAFYRGSKAVGLVYAVDDRSSFLRTAQWYEEIRSIIPGVPMVLAGNKCDQDRQVTFAEGATLARQWDVPFFETSCVSGTSVEEYFTTLADYAVSFAKVRTRRLTQSQ
jgi:small GTP-binding protein